VINPEEGNLVMERLRLEMELRRQLSLQDKRSPTWHENKVLLLALGALLTGVLVPMFQYSQEAIKWHRQNGYDEQKLRLERMRDAVAATARLNVAVAEYDLRVRRVLESHRTTASRLLALEAKLDDIDAERLDLNANIAGRLHSFQQSSVHQAYEEYLGLVESHIGSLRAALATAYPMADKDWRALAEGKDVSLTATLGCPGSSDEDIPILNDAFLRFVAIAIDAQRRQEAYNAQFLK